MKGPTDFKILTVDDDEEIRSSLSMLLEDQGFLTVHAKNGRVALDYLLATPDDKLPDLILMDWMMPVMSGEDFCKSKAGIPRISHIPVVMMTASGNLIKLMDKVEKEAEAYISKPMELETVMQMIEHFLKPRLTQMDSDLGLAT